MFRRWVLPTLLLLFSLISIMVLRSVAEALLWRQILFFGVGAVIFVFSARHSFQLYARHGPFLYVLMVGALFSTYIFAQITRGTRSWIELGPFHIQPSQLAVVVTGLVAVQFVTAKPIQTWRRLLEFATLVGLPAALIFFEPDLGTTVIYIAAMSAVFFLSKTSWKLIGMTMGAVLITLLVGWFFILKPYQKQRITSFLDLEGTHTDAQYNAIQSRIAVGSGQLYGRGLGQGVQSHLRFLPERQTDFVFASFVEETGFFGSALVIGLYFALVMFLIIIGQNAVTAAERYYCFLTAMMLTTQVGINVGMNIGLLPITGITLPLLSYGGSSILSFCFHFGIIQSIVLGTKKRPSLYIR